MTTQGWLQKTKEDLEGRLYTSGGELEVQSIDADNLMRALLEITVLRDMVKSVAPHAYKMHVEVYDLE